MALWPQQRTIVQVFCIRTHSFPMDYERIDQLSKKLFDARIETRLRSAQNLLFKIDSNLASDALADPNCVVKVLDGVLRSLKLLLESQDELSDTSSRTGQLLQSLLELVQKVPVPVQVRQSCIDVSTSILDTLYKIKNREGLSTTLASSLEKSTAKIDLAAVEQHALELMTQGAPLVSAEAKATAVARYQGAGAILNSRLVYTGWKFPAFVLTERDERWLFDVEVAVKLKRDSAAGDLCAVLSELPAPALLLKTNLLRFVLDLVGAPHSQAEADSDPLGLHRLTALRWLERLMVKCAEAFRVQMDGSLCSQVPPARTEGGSDDKGVDFAARLTQAMYALRHPLLPTETAPAGSSHQNAASAHSAQASLSALYPTPSFPGLAFACCAAALPLLQGDSSEVTRAVHSLLRTCLPYVLEPKLTGANGGLLLPVEHGRLQHLFNRVEQLMAFHGSNAFDFEAFTELMGSEEPSGSLSAAARKEGTEAEIASLRSHSCQLLMLSVAVEVLLAAPVDALLPVGLVEAGTRLSVGQQTLATVQRVVAAGGSMEALLPGQWSAVRDRLAHLDPDSLRAIHSTERSLHCAAVLARSQYPSEDPAAALRSLVAHAEAAVGLLDADCPVVAPALLRALVAALPVLLVACCESEDDCGPEVSTLMALYLRSLSCGSVVAKRQLLEHTVAWAQGPDRIDLTDSQSSIVALFDLLPRHGRHLQALLATPAVVQALVVDTCLAHSSVTDTDATASSQPVGPALELLDLLSAFLMNQNLDGESLQAWAQVLLPLKVLEWEPSQVVSSQCARFQFARRIQDLCADATFGACKTSFAKCLVLGMFHSDSAVRINSALRLRRDVLGVPLPAALTASSGGGQDSDQGEAGAEAVLGLLAHDLFGAGSAMALQTWTDGFGTLATGVGGGVKKAAAANNRVPTAAAFTHEQVRKLAAIGFGDLEAGKRATALSQMLEILASDSLLLRTAEAEWVLATARKAILQLESLVPFADTRGLSYSTERLHSLTDAEGRLMLETVRVTRFFVAHSAALRCRVTFHAQDGGDGPCTSGVVGMRPLLRVLLAAASLRPRGSGSAGVDAVRRVAPLCAETLWLLVCSLQSWQPAQFPAGEATAHLSMVHSLVTVDAAGQAIGSGSVQAPSLIAERFLYPVPAGPCNEYSAVGNSGSAPSVTTTVVVSKVRSNVASVHLQCRAAHPPAYPDEAVLQTIVRELSGPTANRIHLETATKLFGLIAEARNHSHLREALSSTLCFCAANPSLQHAFLHLKINFLTAVSGIVTVAPQTHKDHITLACVLDFLQASFASLFAQREAWSRALLELLVEYHNETAAVILPQMCEYLADNFQHANVFFVGLSAGSEEEREQFAASHAVCSSYLRLLHTLSAFHCDGLEFGAHMTGSFVTSLLLHIGTSELHRAHDRATALSTLEHLVRHQDGGWQALKGVQDPNLASIAGNTVRPAQVPSMRSPSKDARLRAGCMPEPEVDPLDHLVRAVRLVRAPDSLQGTSAVLGALRLLHACLLQQDTEPAVPADGEGAGSHKDRWGWLTRLLYDRRSEVKVLAAELLATVLKRAAAVSPSRAGLAQTVDSLEVPSQPPAASGVDDGEASEEGEGTGGDAAEWPPFELLRTIASDDCECTALRTRAITVLVDALVASAATSLEELSAGTLKLSSLFCAMYDCLSMRESVAVSAASIRPVITAALKLLNSGNQHLSRAARSHARAVKLLPAVVEVLNVRVDALLSVRALSRVSVFDEQYVTQDRASYFHGDQITLRSASSAVSELQGAGWGSLFRTHQVQEVDGLCACRTAACWLLHRLSALDAALFEECVTHSRLVHHLTICFSTKPQPLTPHSPCSFGFDCDHITAQAELLSLLIAKEGTSPAGYEPASAGALPDFVGRNSDVPGNLLRKVILVLAGLRDFRGGPQKLQHQIRCISALLRLLSLMVNEPLWRLQLGLGEADGVGALSEPCAYLFGLLLTMRASVSELAAGDFDSVAPPHLDRVSPTAALVSRLDFTVALFMQCSRDARLLFLEQCLLDKHERAAAGSQRALTLLEQHVQVLSSAAEKLQATTGSASAPAGPGASASVASMAGTAHTPAGKTRTPAGTATPLAARAGTASKLPSAAKSPASVTTAPAGGKVNQSMSSWATRTSQGSKWRDKSRGYVWNGARGAGRATATAAEDALCDRDRLQLWSSILVLSAALLDNEQAVDWAIDLQLHHALSKLLRFASIYCKEALLASSITSAALFGAAQSGLWAPSTGMIAAAIGALCASFTHNHLHAKQCFASTGAAAAAVLSGDAVSTTAQKGRGVTGTAALKVKGTSSSANAASLHHLITLGTWKGTIPVTRWLYLSLAGSILSGARNLGAPALKSTFSQIVTLTLQRSLHASHSDPDAVVPLLTTLTSFLSSEEDVALLSQLSRRDQSGVLKAFHQQAGLVQDQAGADEFKAVTFPELVQWVWSALGQRPEVAAALCKCLGRLGMVDLGRKAVGNLLSEDVLRLLCSCHAAPVHPQVGELATLALWPILHYNEKAKGVVREILAGHHLAAGVVARPAPLEGGSLADAEALERARACIDELQAE